jgi:sulfonate transport system ATP-binding protein
MACPQQGSSNNALDIGGLTKRFRLDGRMFTALRSITLDVRAGEFVTIVGVSGCGKSTLLRLIAGLDQPDEGSIHHAGKAIAGPALDRGLVFQEPRLFPWLTVTDNVAVALQNSPMDAAARRRSVAEHIELVGLSGFEKAYPHQLSGGMAQRAAIARGLVNRPDILLLDEPFGALDALTRTRMQNELQRIWMHEQNTMILVTHDVDEAVYLGDRVVVMAPRPGHIRQVFDVPLPHPRSRSDRVLSRLSQAVLTALESDRAPPADHPQPDARTPALLHAMTRTN